MSKSKVLGAESPSGRRSSRVLEAEPPSGRRSSKVPPKFSLKEPEPVSDGENPPGDKSLEDRKSKTKKSGTFKQKTERIPIEVLLGDSFKPQEDTRKKKGKDKLMKLETESENRPTTENESQVAKVEAMPWKGTKSKVINFSVVRELNVRPNKYTDHFVSRSIKMTKNMERPFLVIDDNVDYTPKRTIKPGNPGWLTNPLLYKFPAEKLTTYKPEDLLRNFGNRSSKADSGVGKKLPQTRSSSDDKLSTTVDTDDEEETLSSAAPSMHFLTYPEPPKINKKRLSFKLSETEIIILLDIKSRASEIGDAEALAIVKDNQYQMELKKRLRKTVENYSQTSMVNESNRTKDTQISGRPRANSYCFISNWVYFDALQEAEKKPPVQKERINVGRVDKIIYAEAKSVYEPLIGTNFKICDRLNWFRTGMTMERLLLSNNAFSRQLIFFDLMKSDPLSLGVEFKYELQRLWTLKNSNTTGRTVTCMGWSTCEKNILAVGYGKYSFSDKNKGLIMIWNNKNLANPEREYHFEHPVTSLRFSKIYPAVLAIGFFSGMVMIINIIKHHGTKIVAQNIPSTRSLVFPVWQVAWIKKQEMTEKKTERVVECRGDGCVYKYTRGHLYEKKIIMRVSKMKGLVKGIPSPKKCEAYVIPLVRHPAILCIALHPIDPLVYLIGSDEGAIYKCSLQDVHQHLEMFLAHNGPVYTIQFHPACHKIFLTCGADWYIRVWADGIFSPLIAMISGMSAVQFACWCPSNPTIIASICTTRIELWDISRKINLPQATVENPFGCINTSLAFSNCGNNLCVGDTDGNVFVYTFRGMPFAPVFQDMVLAMALLKALVPHPKLIIELQKLGDPFNVNRIYRNLINLPF